MSYTQIFAHRGLHDAVPENTPAAFCRALSLAIDGIETDIQLTADRKLVLWHDRYLERLGMEQGRVSQLTLAQLQRWRWSGYAADDCRPFLLLNDLLSRDAQQTCWLLEIKSRRGESLNHSKLIMSALSQLLASYATAKIQVSSFNLSSLVYAHDLQIRTPLIYNVRPEQTVAEVMDALLQHRFLYALCLPIERLTDYPLARLRQLGVKLAVYTCNSELQIRLALANRVEILISDQPQRALTIRDFDET